MCKYCDDNFKLEFYPECIENFEPDIEGEAGSNRARIIQTSNGRYFLSVHNAYYYADGDADIINATTPPIEFCPWCGRKLD